MGRCGMAGMGDGSMADPDNVRYCVLPAANPAAAAVQVIKKFPSEMTRNLNTGLFPLGLKGST